MERSNDSPALRATFDEQSIEDGWTIIGEGDAGGGYESDLLMILISPDGDLYEQTSGHCSCYGHEGQWGPYPSSWTALEVMEEKLAAKDGSYSFQYDKEHLDAVREAMEYILCAGLKDKFMTVPEDK